MFIPRENRISNDCTSMEDVGRNTQYSFVAIHRLKFTCSSEPSTLEIKDVQDY